MNTTHKASVSFIGRTQKTAKTECGRVVKTSAIAINTDCTCPGCIAAVDDQWKGVAALIEHGKTVPGYDAAKAERELMADKPRRYHTIIFL